VDQQTNWPQSLPHNSLALSVPRARLREWGLQEGRPVVGILTTGVRQDAERPVGGRTALLGDFVRAAREWNALCYIFNASDIDRERGTVRGVTLVGPPGRERWKMYRFPLPAVVYNRVPHRKAEFSPTVIACKTYLAKQRIPLFNERFLSKREMYNWLLNDPSTVDLTPQTQRMQSAAVMERFCRKHDLVFFKPAGGSLGMGIYRVERGKDHYSVRYRRGKEHVTRTFNSAEQLYAFIKTSNPRSTYMMQQGIRLRRYQGNITDFRVHLHKNGAGLWEAVGIGGKVAGKTAVTTHVHNGGRVVDGEVILAAWYGDDAPLMRERLVEVSLRVCRVLERHLNGPTGELGLDVGIDEQGHVWVFEGNAKPGRAIFRHRDLKQAGRRSARMILEYAAYLMNRQLAVKLARKEEEDDSGTDHRHPDR
jgi:hypothetical protein